MGGRENVHAYLYLGRVGPRLKVPRLHEEASSIESLKAIKPKGAQLKVFIYVPELQCQRCPGRGTVRTGINIRPSTGAGTCDGSSTPRTVSFTIATISPVSSGHTARAHISPPTHSSKLTPSFFLIILFILTLDDTQLEKSKFELP